jgi:hypothetical protein
MKKIVMAIAALASVSSFATSIQPTIMAPSGPFVALSCISVTSKPNKNFSLSVMKNTRSREISMVLNSKGSEPVVYKYVTESTSRAIGGGTLYTAAVMGGMITLSYNGTTSPTPKGRPATLVSQVYGTATKTKMLCSVPNY